MIGTKTVLAVSSILLIAGLSFAQMKSETKEASGTVKSVAADTITITDHGKDMTFIVDHDTSVVAKGATHKMMDAKEAGKSTKITDFVMDKQSVAVKYMEKDGKMYAKEIRVKS
jgi:hypothetical protein